MCQVTRSNFERLFPEILKQIDQSLFLAIDTEFSSLETFSFSSNEKFIRTRDEFYHQRRHLIDELTIFQFGLAIFSSNPNGKQFDVEIYNFSLHPSSIYPIDVKYIVQSSSIEFLTAYQFDFNRCFYDGISFINKTQENSLSYFKTSSGRYSIEIQSYFDDLFDRINQWLIHAELHQTILFDLNPPKHFHLYLLQLEIRRCFQSIWTTIDDQQRLCIERINKEIYEQRMKNDVEENFNKDFETFRQSIVGFTRIIRFISENYRKPIVGHNCFLDWLIIYQKFIDVLPQTFEEYQCQMKKIFPMSIFDTKYLALQMKDLLFQRTNAATFTTLSSLSSLFDLFLSDFYDQSIFFKPTIRCYSNNSVDEKRKHEAGYDAFMSGVVFLKMLYFYRQKKIDQIDYPGQFRFYQICLNDLQLFENRFYSTHFPHLSLNRSDLFIDFHRQYPWCLVVRKHNDDILDLADIQCRLHAYGSFEYQINRSCQQMKLYLPSEQCQRRILNDYSTHSIYKIEEYQFWKHSYWIECSRRCSWLIVGLGLVCISLIYSR